MLNWLVHNLSTIIVSVLILVVVLFILFRLIRQKKQGKSSCGCGCEHCSGGCHK